MEANSSNRVSTREKVSAWILSRAVLFLKVAGPSRQEYENGYDRNTQSSPVGVAAGNRQTNPSFKSLDAE